MSVKFVGSCLLGSLFLSSGLAHADDSMFRPDDQNIVTIGITGGGDELGRVRYSDGDSINITAGGRALFGIGHIWNFEPQNLSLQLDANWQFSNASAKNGDTTFSRFPIELLGFYNVDKWRFGGGVQYVLSPKFSSGLPGASDVDFNNTTGSVVEAGYFINKKFLVSLRYVNEKYTVSNSQQYGQFTLNGSHTGLLASFLF